MNNKSHVIQKVEDLLQKSTDGRRRFKFPWEAGYQSKIIEFQEMDYVRPHRHSHGPVYKHIIVGKIKYGCMDNNEEQIFQQGEIAYVDKNQVYDSQALEYTQMILWEPLGCQIIQDTRVK